MDRPHLSWMQGICPAPVPCLPAKAPDMWPEPSSCTFWSTHLVGLGPAPCGALPYMHAFSAASTGVEAGAQREGLCRVADGAAGHWPGS